MSDKQQYLRQIAELNAHQLAEALEFNGYAECVKAIRTNSIDGEHFLTLTEVQISFWRLPTIQARRFWSFIQLVREDPTQFLLTSVIDRNTLPKVNKSNKLPINKPTSNNTTLKSNRPIGKPNLSFENPNVVENNVTKVNTNNSSSLTTQESKLLKNKLEVAFTRKNFEEKSNHSFIHTWKQPSIPPKPDHLKPPSIELDINKQVEESPDEYSDGYLSPRIFNPAEDKTTETVSVPSVSTSRSNSIKHSNSFLSKYKKNYTHLEIRPKVIENNYEEQNSKSAKVNPRGRPLPPIPINRSTESQFEDAAIFNSADEQLPEYVPISDDDEEHSSNFLNTSYNSNFGEASTINNNNQKFNIKQNSYKSVTTSQDTTTEDLPEYTPILDDTEENNNSGNCNRDEPLPEYTPVLDEDDLPTQQIPLFHRPLPPIPPSHIDGVNKETFTTQTQSFRSNNVKLGDTFSTFAGNKPEPTKERKTGKPLKPPAELPKSSTNLSSLPKPPSDLTNLNLESLNNLPKPPSNLPKPPPQLLTPSATPLKQDSSTSSKGPHHRPLPPLPPPAVFDTNESNVDEEHVPYYSQVDLTTEPCYRQTDRKGARILLSELEDGAFLIRPSRKDTYICTFSIKYGAKMFNVGIVKDASGVLQFASVEPNFQQPKFYSVCDIISYYSRHPLSIDNESIILKTVLPHNRR